MLSRKRKPVCIYSDNGTNFLAAHNDIKDVGKLTIERNDSDKTTTKGNFSPATTFWWSVRSGNLKCQSSLKTSHWALDIYFLTTLYSFDGGQKQF